MFASCGSYTKTITPDYESLKFDVELSGNEQLASIDFKNTTFPISLVWFKEYERTFIKVNDKFLLIELDWMLDDELNPEMDILTLFKNKDNYIIMFPTYTEEFPVFGLTSISKNGTFEDLAFHTYNYSDFKLSQGKMLNGNYLLNDVNDTVRVVLDSNPQVMLSDRWYLEDAGDPISEKEKTMLQELLSNGSGN